jgi:hypothetical protein
MRTPDKEGKVDRKNQKNEMCKHVNKRGTRKNKRQERRGKAKTFKNMTNCY